MTNDCSYYFLDKLNSYYTSTHLSLFLNGLLAKLVIATDS